MPDGAALAVDVASRGQYLFTVDEYQRLPLPDDVRVELIEGVVVPMSPVGSVHFSIVYLLDLILRSAIEPRYRVRSESVVQLGDRTQVAPDISVITPRQDGYRQRLPGPADIVLLVEVSDSTLSRDRRDKVPLYALHGIREFWLVSVAERQMEVHRNPVDGVFQDIETVGLHGTVTPLVASDVRVEVGSLFGEGGPGESG